MKTHQLESAEGRLMGFYSSALAATPLGRPLPGVTTAWSIEVALELGYIPHLSASQRTAGFDKPEASNLSPVLPRPRISLTLPGGLILDANLLPPVNVVDARANLYGASLRRSVNIGAASLAPRVSFLDGRVEGAITCTAELGSGSLSDQQYYANVCHANESRDYFEPMQFSFDLTLENGPRFLHGQSYATVGVRREQTRFDIGVIMSDGSRDLDHPVLEMDATRAFGAAGLQWYSGGRGRVAAEVFYTPGSIVTGRLLVAWRLR